MRVAVTAGGRFHAFHLARQLKRRGMLDHLYTTEAPVISETEISGYVHSYRMLGFIDRAYQRLRLGYLIPPAYWFVLKDNLFDRWWLDQIQYRAPVDLVVGWANYVGGSLSYLKRNGIKLVIESGSRHIQDQAAILSELYAKFGKRAQAISPHVIKKVTQEYEAADAIAVPSHEVAQSFMLYGVDKRKLIVVPYGVDYARLYVKRQVMPEKFRVLFVGMIGLHKGVHLLLDAWRRLKLDPEKAELVLIGANYDLHDLMGDLPPGVSYKGSCAQHELKAEYARASLLVLPSLQEGLAMVQAEALCAGVPVLASERTGARDLFDDGVHGFIVTPGSVQELEERIDWAFHNQEALFAMGCASQHHIKNATWDRYGDRITQEYQRLYRS